MDEMEMPLNWKEKLMALEVGGCEPVDNRSSVYSAIRINFTESDDLVLRNRKFTIREHPILFKPYVWRTN